MNIEETTRAVPESAWFKSSYSTGSGGECIEVASRATAVHIRDSKDLTRCALSASPAAWTAFVSSAIVQAT
ncbi:MULTISPECIES: DUF397 domain-containing protein [Streptomyces]|uniref:DUF397 domain-containing protein n=1 Tax=Streptomyces yunnanensis TaxID=156453 RepID=A0ABY8A580_9ACTN|nr:MULTISPECIES: DUF397 domain-containing protein [Streptomyces]QRX94571.1 DUF397 domain-containing protein [Streptomyces noursei]UJB44282.1 DUF397 domain-containing protein [Streptomyces sp. A1-5]WEB40115.1 DUF397 domain-containing protein [Streptomyces yunnanensis]